MRGSSFWNNIIWDVTKIVADENIRFMQEALREAKEAYTLGEVPIGAILVKDNEIIARGHNETILSNDPTAHAEILVLRRGASVLKNYRLIGSTLYVTVEPCPMCTGAMIQSRIKKLVYGADDLKSGTVRSLYKILDDHRFNHRVEVSLGILKADCANLMQSFFKKLR